MVNRSLVVNCMIEEIEKSFVKRFIKKTKQDRLLFELSEKKTAARNRAFLSQHRRFDRYGKNRL